MRNLPELSGQRVVFATGDAAEALIREVAALGSKRVMLIASASQVPQRVAAELPIVVWHREVAMHVPGELADKATEVAIANEADLILTLGGGSSVGLAKVIALRTGLPIVAVPTTFAGSEATDVWGMLEAGRRVTGADDRARPLVVVYDAALTLSMNAQLTVTSGVHALAHSVDSLWGPNADEVNARLALEAASLLREGLPRVKQSADDLDAREQILSGAYLAAASIASAGSGLHHQICHVVGETFELPSSQTHAAVLPHIVALNAPSAPQAHEQIAHVLGSGSAVDGLRGLYSELGVRGGLRDHGMPESGIASIVDAVLAIAPESNPTPVTKENLTTVVRGAWEGREAGVAA